MAHPYNLFPKRLLIKNLRVNTILILVNVVFFILFSILILINEGYIDYVALKPLNISQGAYIWTFLTSMFMHANLFHLFVNMFSLFFIGSLIERILGPKRYLYFYLASGLFAGIFFVAFSLLFNVDVNTFAVGASGALFGVAGLMTILTPNLPLYVMFIPIPIKAKYAIPGLLAILWLISITGEIPIGNTAHLGGLILGLGFGIYLRKKYKNKTRKIRKYFS